MQVDGSGTFSNPIVYVRVASAAMAAIISLTFRFNYLTVARESSLSFYNIDPLKGLV